MPSRRRVDPADLFRRAHSPVSDVKDPTWLDPSRAVPGPQRGIVRGAWFLYSEMKESNFRSPEDPRKTILSGNADRQVDLIPTFKESKEAVI